MRHLREARLEAALRNLAKVSVEERVKERLRDLIEWGMGKDVAFREEVENPCILALSGGADSVASLLLAKRAGLNPRAVTVVPNSSMMDSSILHDAGQLCQRLSVHHEILWRQDEFYPIFSGALAGRYHPCGRCHDFIVKKIYKYAKSEDAHSVVFGDTLSCGSESVKMLDGITRINMPAMLAMTKRETQEIAGRNEIETGCSLLKRANGDFPQMKRYSIARVLRETRACVLEPRQAQSCIESILGIE